MFKMRIKYLFMQLSCVITRDNILEGRDFYFLVFIRFKFKMFKLERSEWLKILNFNLKQTKK